MSSLNAFSFESLQSSEKVTKLTSGVYKDAEKAFLTCESGDCRFRYDSDEGVPSAWNGHLLKDGAHIILQGSLQIQAFRFIQVGDIPATLQITYERL